MPDSVITVESDAVMQRAARLETGGIAAFTSYFLAPVGGTPRWEYVGVAPDKWELNPDGSEYVPWIPLPWQKVVAHDIRLDGTIIGGFGSGKTVGVGCVGAFLSCMIPLFKFIDVAPVGWQSRQMYDMIKTELCDWDNRDTRPKHITPLIKSFVSRPYPKITFFNGSTMEFMSADEEGEKILSWSGDMAVIDEAGKLDDLDTLLMNLGSRTRGVVGARARLGRLIVMANADYNPQLWERYDMAKDLPNDYYSLHVTSYDNPYLTEGQLKAMGRRIRDPEKRKQFMLAERPIPRGKEFTPALLEPCRNADMDDIVTSGIENMMPGFRREEMRGAGVWLWEIPADPNCRYIVVGDPGQNAPPNRNSPCIGVFDVSAMPSNPAFLAAFWWGDGRGSYWPFIYKMEEYTRLYKPIYSAFDSTGVQKGFNELVFEQRGMICEGLNMQGMKMQMVVTLKLLMGRGMIQLPSSIAGIWMQLANWHMPDTKLRQDIASMLFMSAHCIQRLYVDEMPDENLGDADENTATRNRNADARVLRSGIRNKRATRN